MEKLLTIDQVSELLQVSKSLVYKWAHYQFVPYMKIGALIRFRESDLIRWLKLREKKGRSKVSINIGI